MEVLQVEAEIWVDGILRVTVPTRLPPSRIEVVLGVQPLDESAGVVDAPEMMDALESIMPPKPADFFQNQPKGCQETSFQGGGARFAHHPWKEYVDGAYESRKVSSGISVSGVLSG